MASNDRHNQHHQLDHLNHLNQLNHKKLKIGIVGATGAVGREFISCLNFRGIIPGELRLFASENSKGKTLPTPWGEKTVEVLYPDAPPPCDYFLLSAGGETSKQMVPGLLKNSRAKIIDNSSAFRMDKEVPLVVPSINPHHLTSSSRLVSNPNCSTIQKLMAIHPIHLNYGVRSVSVASLQSVAGSGNRAIACLNQELKGYLGEGPDCRGFYPVEISGNLWPVIGDLNSEGESQEEVKMRKESQKILGSPELRVDATCIRVPVVRGHSGSVSLTLEKPAQREPLEELFKKDPNLVYYPQGVHPPTPRFLTNPEKVHVGRLRVSSEGYVVNLWQVADNLWIGAALNGVDILLKMEEISSV